MVILRVTGLDGKVLCGPEDVSGRVSDLKSRLITESALDSMTVCLIHDREELASDSLIELIASRVGDPAILELTAIWKPSMRMQLAQLTKAARESASKRQTEAKRPRSSEIEQKERKESDIREYRNAFEDLVQQLGEEGLQKCRMQARKGEDEFVFAFHGGLQFYDLGAKMYFRFRRDLRTDPVLRGWYLTMVEPEALECPDLLEMKDYSEPMARFTKELRDVLVEHFRGMDLVAGISGHIIDRLTISWKTDEAK
mmetsp:Transcript_21842/g.45040  ORF Transcript_21842/g.45040 Transcript_21842/m.45040 type:complete len:255 (-) Transcript_21842:19-783(-)